MGNAGNPILAEDIDAQDERLPWLSWATTGVLTLAAVLIFGLILSTRRPREQASSPIPARTNTGAKPSASNPAKPISKPIVPAVVPQASPVVSEPLKSPQPSSSNERVNHAVAPNLTTKPQAAPSPIVKVEPRQSVKSTAVTVPPDRSKHAAYVKAVSDVRRSMAIRDIANSKKHLGAAAENAQTEAEKTEVERLDMIQDYLEQFWDGIRKAVAAMQPAEEIVLSEVDRVAVIEASRTELAVQTYGRPQRYKIEALPMPLLSAIAKSSFKLTPGTKLVVGAFLAMDAHGNRSEARKLWQEAIAAGQSDGKLLLPEINIADDKAK
jgi:hypothetical protein